MMNTTARTQLPLPSRIQATEDLWDSLCRDESCDASPGWHEDVLRQRLEELAQGQVTPWDETRERLRASSAAVRS
jgi:Putative addiction module component